MSLRCIGLKISIFILFFPYYGYTQHITIDTIGFYKHLAENHLLREQAFFNKKLQQNYSEKSFVTDSLKLDLASIYLQLNLPDSCKKALHEISNNFHFSGRSNQRYLSMLLLNHEYNLVEKTIFAKKDMELDNTYRRDLELSLTILKREALTFHDTCNQLSLTMNDLKKRYQHIPNHSPFLAGTYSALIPGMGKWYLGYKYQATTAFILNMLLASQAVESYLKTGVSSPRFIITSGVFSIFYIGNIWGSVLSVKKQKRDYLNQLDNEIFDYHKLYTDNFAR